VAPGASNVDALDAIARAKRPYVIALVVRRSDAGDPFVASVERAFQDSAREIGATPRIVTIDTPRAPSIAYPLPTDSKVDAACELMPPGQDAWAGAGRRLFVHALAGAAPPGSNASSHSGYIGSSQVEIGRAAAAALASAGSPSGRLAILSDLRPGCDTCEPAFRNAFKGSVTFAPTVWNVGDAGAARRAASALLAKYPDLGGIFCTRDALALGAADAVDSAGSRGRVRIVGVDGIAAARGAIDRGRMYATVAQQTDFIGKYAARAAVALLDGNLDHFDIDAPVVIYKKR